MKTITSLKEVKTAKFLRKQALEDDGLEIWHGNHIENTKLDSDGMYSQEGNNWIDATVEGGNPEDKTVIAGLLKQEINFAISRLAERCHNTDILKDAKRYLYFQSIRK